MREPEGRLYLKKGGVAKGSQGRDSSWRNSDPKMVRFQRQSSVSHQAKKSKRLPLEK